MKVIYTESGLKELDKFHESQRQELEEVIRRRKFVFGDEQLEITASDIKEAGQSFTVTDRSYYRMRRIHFVSFLLRIFAVAGIILAMGGMFYPFFRDLYRENSPQFSLVIVGVSTTIYSIFMMYFLRQRVVRFGRMADLEDMRVQSLQKTHDFEEIYSKYRDAHIEADLDEINAKFEKIIKANKSEMATPRKPSD